MGAADEPTDLRLAIPVGAVWVGAWGAPLMPLSALGVVVTGIVVAAVCLARARRAGQRLTPWLMVGALMLMISALSMAFRVAHLEADPLASWAESERHVTATGVLISDPTFVSIPGFGGAGSRQVRVEVRVEHLVAGNEHADLRTPVLVLGDGSGWEELRWGDTVEISGSLAPTRHVEPVGAVLFSNSTPSLESRAPLVLRGAEAMRSGLRDAVGGLPTNVQGLLPALVVGDTSEMPPLLTSDLRDSGLAHLTAVSGANVAMVVGAALLLARWAGVRAYALVGVGLVVVVWFVLLARPQPSVMRAAVMGSIALVAVGMAGRTQAVRTLLTAAIVLLLVDPWLARSWGFALSVAATGGLVMLARRWSARLPSRWPKPLRDAVAVAVAAQIATLPLVVALSGQIAVLSVIANLLAAPAVPLATVLGAASAVIAPVLPPVATTLTWLGQWPTAWIANVAAWASTRPLATLPWPDGWWGALLALLALAIGWGVWRRGASRRWWRPIRVIPVALAVTCLVVAFLVGPGRWPPPGWVIVACDVGQGDALVVNLGDGAAMVIDAGPDPALVERCLDRLHVEHVPLLVLTHFHADHVAGVPGVLATSQVDTVLVSPLHDPPEQAASVAQWTTGLDVVEAVPGQVGTWGEASWRVLWPGDLVESEGSAANNASVVLVVEVSDVSMLLTGDVEPDAQRAILVDGLPQVDVLKVPHHGSRHQEMPFLQASGAAVALVSTGEDNNYGHPDPDLLESLTQEGMLVARTDQQGSLAVLAEGEGLRVVAVP